MRPFFAAAVFTLALVPTQAQEPVDLATVHRIRQEALQNSKVMDHLFQLTDVTGSRLTNSPGFYKAADWIVKQMKEYGIDAKQEAWGPFGRGWHFTHYSGHMIEPTGTPLIGVPLAWTPGTNGPVTGEAMIVDIPNTNAGATEAFERYKGKLKGKIVFMGAGRELTMNNAPLGRRYTDQELDGLSTAAVAAGGGRGGRGGPPGTAALAAGRGRGGNAQGAGQGGGQGGGQPSVTNQIYKFLSDEGVAVVVRSGTGASEGGTVFAQAGGSRESKDPVPPPSVALTPEHYNRVLRLLDKEIPVQLGFDIRAEFLDDRTDSINVVAEIPGRRKRDEVVMIGAHLDSWHGGTGATDNAAGCAVMIEAMRILKELNLPMDRTVRMALWGGEEQGLFGSRKYVDEHFANREDMKLKGEHAKLSGYFNVDNGTGKIRGVYLQGNDMMRPIFESWFKPFADLGAATITVRNTGGTDHQSFDAVGLPGFQFIQDPAEYNTRTHHSNMDVYDRIQREDMQQMAAIVASFVYNAATRPDLLPRKPLPKAQPPQGGGRGGN